MLLSYVIVDFYLFYDMIWALLTKVNVESLILRWPLRLLHRDFVLSNNDTCKNKPINKKQWGTEWRKHLVFRQYTFFFLHYSAWWGLITYTLSCRQCVYSTRSDQIFNVSKTSIAKKIFQLKRQIRKIFGYSIDLNKRKGFTKRIFKFYFKIDRYDLINLT